MHENQPILEVYFIEPGIPILGKYVNKISVKMAKGYNFQEFVCIKKAGSLLRQANNMQSLCKQYANNPAFPA